MGLAATFSGLTVLLVVAALAARQPLVLLVAIPFGLVAYVTYRQATGRLLTWTGSGPFGNRSHRSARQGGPERGRRVADDRRGPWTGATRRRQVGGNGRRAGGTGPSEREAYRILDLDPGANEATIRKAYRRKVKDVHPDADGGDEDEFKRVTEAYETLRERRR